MPDLGQILEEEIPRLGRGGLRQPISGLESNSAAPRRSVAGLRRAEAALSAEARARRESQAFPVASGEISGTRFTPESSHGLRKKLDVSQAELASLVGMTAQTVYVRENKDGRLRARDGSKSVLSGLRTLGAREARRRLEQSG